MRYFKFVVLTLLVILTSCEKYNRDTVLVIGNMEFNVSDIRLYDTSAHVLYLNKSYNKLNDIETGTFTFLDEGESVLSGSFCPGYMSSIPTGPIISSCPFALQSFALKLETWDRDKRSTLNNAGFLSLMSRHNLLHSGVGISDAILNVSGSELVLSFTVTNADQASLLLIDPEKTGQRLYRYFTNGLTIYDLATNSVVFEDNIQHEAPVPWDSWSMNWLSELKPGESKVFTFTYNLSIAPAPGEYEVVFGFPGLSYQVAEEELYQGSARIWLGDVILRQRMTIQ